MKSSKQLHTLYSWIFISMSFLIIAVVILIAGWHSSHNLREESGKALLVTANAMGDQLDQHMWARYGEVKMLAELEQFRNPTDLDQTQRLIDRFKETFPMFSWIGLTDEQGIVLASTDNILEGADSSERPAYMEAQKGDFIGDVHDAVLLSELLPNPTGEPLQFVDISVPLNNSTPSPVLATHLSWEWARGVESQIMEPLESNKKIELFIVSERDQLVLLGPEQWVGKPLSPSMIEWISSSPEEGWDQKEWSGGREYVTAFAKTDGYLDYEGLGWTIIARQPVGTAYTAANDLLLTLIGVGLTLALVSGALGSLFTNRLMRPIRELSLAADELRMGARDQIPVQKGIAEFESLSLSLNSMIEKLRDSNQRLGTMELAATNDYLTGLPNRRGLESLSYQYEYETPRYLFYMDLDGFKQVNDTLGHHAGDQLLIQMSNRVMTWMTVGDFMARVGGDEFVFITYGTQENAEKHVRQLINEITSPYYIVDAKAVIGISAGGIEWPKDRTLEEALTLADAALYDVKKNGKNNVKISS